MRQFEFDCCYRPDDQREQDHPQSAPCKVQQCRQSSRQSSTAPTDEIKQDCETQCTLLIVHSLKYSCDHEHFLFQKDPTRALPCNKDWHEADIDLALKKRMQNGCHSTDHIQNKIERLRFIYGGLGNHKLFFIPEGRWAGPNSSYQFHSESSVH